MANVSSSNGLEKRPKLRFPGFDDPWKVFKAEELFQNITDRNHPDETVLTIIQGKGTLPREQAGRNIHYDDASLSNYKKVEQGDFIIHLRSFEGGLEMANEAGIVSPAYTILRCKRPHSSLFYDAYFHTDEFINHNLSKSVEGIRDGRQISYEAFKWLGIPYCEPTEQEKISTLFSAFNERIAKQRDLVESLKKYKRGLLNKVFSNTDEKIYPTVYLSEVADFLQGLTYSPSDVANAGHLVLRSSNIQNGTLSFDDCVYVDKSIPESLQVKCADVIMCVRNGSKSLVGKTALIPIDMPKTTWGAFMMIVRSKLNDTYIFHYLNSQMFFSQVFKDTGTATINQITKGILNECRLPLPPVEERKKISKMLSTFDAKIYNAERTLYALMETRKALLQQLFI